MGDKKNRPPFRLQIKGKDGSKGRNYNAGCAFINKVGGLTLYLNPGVVLDYRTTEEFFVNLNPADEAHGGPPGDAAARLGSLACTRGADEDTFDGAPDEDDDIPFG